MSAEPPELVDVVDDHDQVVRTVTRARMRAERLQHRAVFIAVIDHLDRVLVHRRSEHKDLWPGWWDIAVGGVVASGEHYDDAARRELREEVGLHAQPVAVGGGRYVDDDVALLGRCYVVHHEPATHGEPRPVDGEVVEWMWVPRADLRAWAAERRVLPDSVALLGEWLFPSA
jgi:8-oxo-dGTP pyrophosphatase MutT (NUDIX family)